MGGLKPKTRLTLQIVAIVAATAAVLSGVYLERLLESKLGDLIRVAQLSGEQVKNHLIRRVLEQSRDASQTDLAETKRRWLRLVREDPLLPPLLIGTIASSGAVVEILISYEDGRVIAASNPARLAKPAPPAASLRDWSRQSVWRKLWQVLTSQRDLELRVPLGVAATGPPVFTVHVIVSTVLLREAVVPELRSLAAVSLLCLLASTVLAALLARIAGRPLERVEQIIDQIAQGKAGAELPPPAQDGKLAAIESKLALLGQRIRGASQSADELRGRMDELLARLEGAIFLFDRHGRLVLAGGATDRFLGLSRWEGIGRSLEEVFPPSSAVGALVAASVEHRQRLTHHRAVSRLPDGAEIQLLVGVEVIEEFPSRERRGVIVTLRDAESRRQLESELDASWRREAIGRLLEGVAHEIKNPLNSISTHVQLLGLELGERAPELRQEIEIIAREIKTLDRMVVTLLDFTRPLELHLDETDLVELAREIAGLVAPGAAARGVTVVVDSELEAAFVRADRPLLRQAVMNVVLNGIESIERTGQVRLAVTASGGGYVLSVSDEGCGIPPEIRDKIFHLYFTTKGRGSGIGLAMTYRVVQLHGARLDFDSRPGEGTTFRFTFPAAAQPVAASAV